MMCKIHHLYLPNMRGLMVGGSRQSCSSFSQGGECAVSKEPFATPSPPEGQACFFSSFWIPLRADTCKGLESFSCTPYVHGDVPCAGRCATICHGGNACLSAERHVAVRKGKARISPGEKHNVWFGTPTATTKQWR